MSLIKDDELADGRQQQRQTEQTQQEQESLTGAFFNPIKD